LLEQRQPPRPPPNESAGYIDLTSYASKLPSTSVTAVVQGQIVTVSDTLGSFSVDQRTAYGFAIAFTIVTIIYFLLVCVMMKRLITAVRVIQEAAKAVAAIPTLLCYPCVTVVFIGGFCVFWVIITLYLASAGEFDPKTMTFTYATSTTCTSALVAANYSSSVATKYCSLYKGAVNASLTAAATALTYNQVSVANASSLSLSQYRSLLPVTINSASYNYILIYHVFGFLWTVQFIIYASYMVMAGAVATWYWTMDKRVPPPPPSPSLTLQNLPRFPVLGSLRRVLRYHLGSVAFGSLIIAIVQMIRIAFNYIMMKLKKADDHPAVKIMICVINCCLACLERFLNFLNKNAFIMVPPSSPPPPHLPPLPDFHPRRRLPRRRQGRLPPPPSQRPARCRRLRRRRPCHRPRQNLRRRRHNLRRVGVLQRRRSEPKPPPRSPQAGARHVQHRPHRPADCAFGRGGGGVLTPRGDCRRVAVSGGDVHDRF
jgi:hypothetical protein